MTFEITYCNCSFHQLQDWRLQWFPLLCSETGNWKNNVYLGQRKFKFEDWCWILWLFSCTITSSSQLQPRSLVTLLSESDAGDGGVTSSGLVGWNTGSFSMSFRLPWVPLLGAGFNPNKSDAKKQGWDSFMAFIDG